MNEVCHYYTIFDITKRRLTGHTVLQLSINFQVVSNTFVLVRQIQHGESRKELLWLDKSSVAKFQISDRFFN